VTTPDSSRRTIAAVDGWKISQPLKYARRKGARSRREEDRRKGVAVDLKGGMGSVNSIDVG